MSICVLNASMHLQIDNLGRVTQLDSLSPSAPVADEPSAAFISLDELDLPHSLTVGAPDEAPRPAAAAAAKPMPRAAADAAGEVTAPDTESAVTDKSGAAKDKQGIKIVEVQQPPKQESKRQRSFAWKIYRQCAIRSGTPARCHAKAWNAASL